MVYYFSSFCVLTVALTFRVELVEARICCVHSEAWLEHDVHDAIPHGQQGALSMV